MTPSDVITAKDIPVLGMGIDKILEEPCVPLASDSYREAKMDFERQFLIKKLKEFNGNISKTAEAIGLERSNLHRKIKSYGIEVKEDSPV